MQTNKKQVVIVDYKMGNLKSVMNALNHLGCDAIIADNKNEVSKAEAIILPGVGAFGMAMKNLTDLGLIEILNKKVIDEKTPFLGICLGLQLIAEDSEEKGFNKGLGWLPGHVRYIRTNELRVPLVGWNNTKIFKQEPIFKGMVDTPDFYYVHSYQLECDQEYIAATCEYGEPITAAVQHKNIFAVQFHPEKSQFNGLKLLKNFLNYVKDPVHA